MTSEKAISMLRNLAESIDNYYNLNDEGKEVFEMAIEALEERAVNRWVSCSEKMPDERDAGILKALGINKRSDPVLATIEIKGERIVDVVMTYDGEWHWDKKYAFPDKEIIAWMPFPDVYKGDKT